MKLRKLSVSALGSFLFAVGVICFLNPANIAPGGVSGISIIINYLTDFPIGLCSLLINVPILIIGYLKFGKRIIIYTIPTLLFYSVLMDFVIKPFFPIYSSNRLLASVFGGLFQGGGIGLIFSVGSTTGGTDIISMLIQRRYPHIKIGVAVLITDMIIVLISAFVYKDIETILYSIISIYSATKMMDLIIYNGEKASIIFVFSPKANEITKCIIEKHRRGATIIDGTGGYSSSSQKIIICAVLRKEFPQIKSSIFSIDGNAFIAAAYSEGIYGEGFFHSDLF